MPVEISELDATAADAAVALWQACGLTRPWNDPYGDFQRAVEGESSAVLGTYDGDELIGTAMVGVDGHRGWVYYVASAPGRRGQGIGHALMATTERWVEARGMPKIQLMVRRSNTAVVDFYSALGYEEQDCVVLGRRFDGSNGGAVVS
jgi:ribosomal protein S18 acetylase RimI-like enzyme